MARQRFLRFGAPLGAFVALSSLAALASPEAQPDGTPLYWYSVAPPLLAICLAIATQRIMASLGAAILVGGLLAAVPGHAGSPAAWAAGVRNTAHYVWVSAVDSTNMQLLAFVVLVMAMIGVIVAAGGMQGIVQLLQRLVRGRRSAQTATALLGLTIFIDDYANTMIVGPAMRPVTDAYRISREKLAFLVDATSAPIAGLAVFSTWVGYEAGLFGQQGEQLGIARDGYTMFLDALPFRFYCILMIGFVLINVLSGRDFGPMARAEHRARKRNAVLAADAVPLTSRTFAAAEAHPDARISATTAVVPIASVFLFFLAACWIDGGGMQRMAGSPSALLRPTAWRDAFIASENSILLLAAAATVGVIVAWLMGWVRGGVGARTMGRATLTGMRTSILPMTILVLAWSLKEACDALGTAPLLVATVGSAVPAALFPAVTFVIASVTSFATGTSFGTMAILIPTATPLAFQLDGAEYGLVTTMTMAAVLDGAIFGDHCSPISDTTIMSSISSSCDHLHHVRTQLPYSLTVAAVALFCGYLPVMRGVPSWVGIVVGLLLMVALFRLAPQPRDDEPPTPTLASAGTDPVNPDAP